jgi:PilZ domain
MMDEKRQTQRLAVNLSTRWEGTSGSFGTRIEDISVRGCFINTLGAAHVGDLINLEIKTLTEERLSVGAKVASCLDGMGFGVRFVFRTVEEEISISRLISNLNISALASD